MRCRIRSGSAERMARLCLRDGVSREATFDSPRSHGDSEVTFKIVALAEIGAECTRPSQRTRRSGAPWTIEFSTHPYSAALSFELLAGSTQFVTPPVLATKRVIGNCGAQSTSVPLKLPVMFAARKPANEPSSK